MNVAQAKSVNEQAIETFTNEQVDQLINEVAEVNETMKPLNLIKKHVSIKVKEYMVRSGQIKIVTDEGNTATLTTDHDRLCAIDTEDAQALVAEGKLSREAFDMVYRNKRIAASLKIA